MLILVSGGASFIGSHLVEQLVRQAHTVRVLDALVPQVHGAGATWPERSLTQEVELHYGDVAEPQVWERALAGIDAVYHLAAEVGVGQSMYEIVRYMRANTLGTAVLLETLISGRYPLHKLIAASSMFIYSEGAYRCPACGAVAPPLRDTAQLEARQWELRCPHCQAALAPCRPARRSRCNRRRSTPSRNATRKSCV